MAASAAGCVLVGPCVAVRVGPTRSGATTSSKTARLMAARCASCRLSTNTRGNACCSKRHAASRPEESSTPWKRSWSAAAVSRNTSAVTTGRSSWPSPCKSGWAKHRLVHVILNPALLGNRAQRDSLPKAARRVRRSRGKTLMSKASMPKFAWNCWIASSSSTCAKSMRRPAITPTNTTSNDRTAAWEKDPLPSRRSANFRSGLRPALQFALVMSP